MNIIKLMIRDIRATIDYEDNKIVIKNTKGMQKKNCCYF